MLWPNDAQLRTEAERTAEVQSGLELSDLLGRSDLLALARRAAEAVPLTEVQNRVAANKGGPFVQGLIAGEILFLSLFRVKTGAPDAAMKRIVADIAKQVRAIWAIEPHTIENRVWKEYRCVSNFWAAHTQLASAGGRRYPFPCALRDLGDFLGLAEAFRVAGESTKTKQSRAPVLRPGECIQLPADMQLPKFELRLSPADGRPRQH